MKLNKEVIVYQLLSSILFLLFACTLIYLNSEYLQDLFPAKLEPNIQREAPFSKEIEEIMRPLKYSALPDLAKEKVTLRIDPEKGLWALENMREYAENGDLILTDGKYGICGELAWYTHQKLKPLLGQDYAIDFIYAAESNFFPAESSTHILLRLLDLKSFPRPMVYMIDPSFKKYGAPKEFENYLYFNPSSSLEYIEKKETSTILEVGYGMPIFINGNVLLTLSVLRSGGLLDQDNFSLVVVATRRHNYSGNIIHMISKKQGQTQVYSFERKKRLFLTNEIYQKLETTMIKLFQSSEFAPINNDKNVSVFSESIRGKITNGSQLLT